MNDLKSINLHEIPSDVYSIFRKMFKSQVRSPLHIQVLHGLYLAYLISIFIFWFYVDLLYGLEFYDMQYYSTTVMYFIALAIVSFALNKKLCNAWGLINPLRARNRKYYTSEKSIEELKELLLSKGALAIYTPCILADSAEMVDVFIEASHNHSHLVYILEYQPNPLEQEATTVYHIVDPGLIETMMLEWTDDMHLRVYTLKEK